MEYPRTSRILQIIPFLAFVDFTSTLFALSYGGQESFPLPAYFLNNWGSLGLFAYSIIVFTCLQFTSNFLIIKPLRNTCIELRRSNAIILFIVIVFYYAAFSYWTSIVVLNFLFPLNFGSHNFIVRYIVLFVTTLIQFLYTRNEIFNLFSY